MRNQATSNIQTTDQLTGPSDIWVNLHTALFPAVGFPSGKQVVELNHNHSIKQTY
jgi:hypothetical protein